MKSNKTKVFEFIQEYSIDQSTDEYPRLTTQFLSEKLNMQRTNLSSILNQLVKEGKITKSNGRPVLYWLTNTDLTNQNDFEDLIGYNQSLSEAVMLAKAAILYPQGSPHILISGQNGSGIRCFVNKVYDFAVKSKVLKNNAPFTVFDCKTFIENQEVINELLFGDGTKKGLIHETNHGMLFIRNVELLSGYQRTKFFELIDNNHQALNLPHDYKCIIICTLTNETPSDINELFRNKMDFVIEIPSLNNRTLKERFALLEKFLKQEAASLDRVIEVSSATIHALLLYKVNDNILGLKNDIHKGVANCYVREHSGHHHIELLLSDFPNYVRKGMIYYKTYKEEINLIIPGDCKFAFTKNEILKNKAKENNSNIYHAIDTKKKELKKQSVSEEEIENLVSLQLQQDFQKYFKQLNSRVTSYKELKKIVSDKLITLVEKFIMQASNELSCSYDENVLFGLCLHINASLIKIGNKQRIANAEIKRLIDTYPKYYHLAKDFIGKIEHIFRVKMNIDEIIFVMLFILKKSNLIEEKNVVTLIAMHGDCSASSIVNVVNNLALKNNSYAYDLSLKKNMDEAYEELKQLILDINQDKGIILIYDMGSIRTMAESIAFETKINIKYLEMPITLIGVASSNKASENCSVDEIYDYLQGKFKDIKYFRKRGDDKIVVIISKDFKEINTVSKYINDNFKMKDIQLYPIELTDLNNLYNQINVIANEGKIIGIISKDKLNLAQYPMIKISQVYQSRSETLEDLFIVEDDINEIFDYLKDQFDEIDVMAIKENLLLFISKLEEVLDTNLDEDQQIGLIVHLICLIDRISRHQAPIVNFLASSTILKYGVLISKVKELLIPIETALNITISDAEIATIISIIKKNN